MLRITEETVQPFEKEHIDLVRKQHRNVHCS